MSLVLRGDVGRRLSVSEMDGNFTYLQQLAITGTTSNINTFEVTYSQLSSLIENNSLNRGTYYIITDYKTCYDQPDYDIYGNAESVVSYKQGEVEPLMVLAIADNNISSNAYQPAYPNDIIKYDYSWTQSEITGGTAYGRITERIDEWNNRTDYDHRTCLFKRYEYYNYDPSSPQIGTVSLSNMTLTGVGTEFTSFTSSNIIAIPNFEELFFKIVSIDSDTSMSLTGSINNLSGSNLKYYSTGNMGFVSYKKTNVSNGTYSEFTTFGDAILDSNAYNNYIGDHSIGYIKGDEGNFLLANNVFLSGSYYNNKIGNSSYNNTFNDDCTNNNIGTFFLNNITDDDFDSNNIGDHYQNNVISSNFQYNIVKDYFENNTIHCNSFNNNIISSDYYNNILSGDVSFNNNTIGNVFDSNTIFSDFHDNQIYNSFYGNLLKGVSGQFYENIINMNFHDNNIYYSFYGNKIGNSMYSNSIYNNFYDNKIGNNFNNNTIGEYANMGNGGFYLNDIKNDVKSNFFIGDNYGNYYGDEFYTNELSYGTYNNKFGNFSLSNNMGEYFVNNVIGNWFESNIIGNNFKNNNISNSFYNNDIGNNFQLNDIKADEVSGYDFTINLHKIISITYSANGASASDGIYTDIAGTTTSSINGINSTFNVEVNTGAVTSVSINNGGKLYENNDTIRILGSDIGGFDSTDDILITVTGLYTPPVYGYYNSQIFIKKGDNIRLSYYDEEDALIIKDINE